jgi:glutamate synthases, NADH/NADPH, small subunit
MGDLQGFLKYSRQIGSRRPVAERIKDNKEFEIPLAERELGIQGARCMDCGVPFCHWGCPLGNVIPEWNDLVYRGRWKDAIESLHATNNFPEFTGRVCPAPCETSCVCGINDPSVTIKQIEHAIIDRAFKEGWVEAMLPATRSGKRVAIVGSGPAGLAAAAELNHFGHTVTVFERSDRIGGLLTYGIPDFKLEKSLVQRRVDIMTHEGVNFRINSTVGGNVDVEWLKRDFQAICLAGGATLARDLPLKGRDLPGIHLAIDYLSQQNRRVAGESISEEQSITAAHKDVIVIGGGDTGSDCVGTAIRQEARSVTQIEILPQPPPEGTPEMPWPSWPAILRTSSSHEEGCRCEWAVRIKSFEGRNRVEKAHFVRVAWSTNESGCMVMKEVAGGTFSLAADLVLLAMGFSGPEKGGMLKQLEVLFDERGNVATDENMATNIPGVFAAGDMRRGQSLVVWAIAEGRKVARKINSFLAKTK